SSSSATRSTTSAAASPTTRQRSPSPRERPPRHCCAPRIPTTSSSPPRSTKHCSRRSGDELMRSGRPEPGEYGAHAEADIARVEGDDAIEALTCQARQVEELFGNRSETAVAGLRYAP